MAANVLKDLCSWGSLDVRAGGEGHRETVVLRRDGAARRAPALLQGKHGGCPVRSIDCTGE